MTDKISLEGISIIEAGPEDSISVHTYYGDKGGRVGKQVIIRRTSEQTGISASTEKHSANDLCLARNVMAHDPDNCYSYVMGLMSRETELSISIRKIYREYGFDTKTECIPKMIRVVDLEIEHIDCLPLHI